MFRELAERLLAGGREVSFTAHGVSMTPFIRDAEYVRVRPLQGRPHRGDVVLCIGALGELMLHRVVRLTSTAVITCGDALSTEDQPVPISRVIGRAVAVSGRRRLHLSFPFGLIVSFRRRLFPRSANCPRIRRAACRLQEIGARV